MWIFGTGKAAECVIAQVGKASVYGICVDDQYIRKDQEILGFKPVPFSHLRVRPSREDIFVALGYRGLNSERSTVLERLRKDGFPICNVIPRDFCLDFITHGINNFFMAGANIQPHTTIEDNVFIWSGATVCHHVEIGSNVWVTAGATIAGGTKIGSNVFIGANATIASGLSIGSNVFIGAGTLVTTNVGSNEAVAARSSEALKVSSNTFVRYLEAKGTY
jgi:sugar O-acyltransferase (sialic acid O-acetyltransferase NeuD family)